MLGRTLVITALVFTFFQVFPHYPAYLLVIVVEPLADLGVLAAAKGLHQLRNSPILERRLFSPA